MTAAAVAAVGPAPTTRGNGAQLRRFVRRNPTLAAGGLTLALVALLAIAAPLFAGDTLYATSTVLEKRESASRPNAGIVSVRTVGTNQKDVEVCTFERTMLIAKRGGLPQD